jgi:hypothetical protein
MVGKLSLIVGTKDIVDRPPSGRTATAVTTDTKHKADALIQEDGRITTSETGGYGHHQRSWLQKILRKVGAGIGHP